MECSEQKISPEDTRNIILRTQEPLLIKNLLKSELVSWSLKDWNEMINGELLNFRIGKYHYTKDPQWEATCRLEEDTFQEFLNLANDSKLDNWWYFDYKHLFEWFRDREELKNKIDWSAIGFPEVTISDATIWIGSKGAHTPCHQDTYGCNVVFQIYGRKQWILFPPEQNLKPSRIPFEESSIYSTLNFFSPREEDFKGLRHCHKIILNPGDVLVVPPKWWHYVENLETAISINVWLPLPEDDLERVKESVATIFVGQMVHTVNTQVDCKNYILNPNMIKDLINYDEALDLMCVALESFKSPNKVHKTSGNESNSRENYDYLENLLAGSKFITKIPTLDEEEFRMFLHEQSQRFTTKEAQINTKEDTYLPRNKLKDFLEAITDDEVLSLIAKKLIEKRTGHR